MADPPQSQGQHSRDASPVPPRDSRSPLPPNVQQSMGQFPPNQGQTGQFSQYQGPFQGPQQQYYQGSGYNQYPPAQAHARPPFMGSTENIAFQHGAYPEGPYAVQTPGFQQPIGRGGQYQSQYDPRFGTPQGPHGMWHGQHSQGQQARFQTPPQGQQARFQTPPHGQQERFLTPTHGQQARFQTPPHGQQTRFQTPQGQMGWQTPPDGHQARFQTPPGQQTGWQTSPDGQFQSLPAGSQGQPWQQQQQQTSTKFFPPEAEDQSPKEPIRTVRVAGIGKGTTDETLQLYFESKKKSGGGDIEDITVNPDGSAVIVFEDHETAAKVCQRKVHEYDGNKWTVSLQRVPEKTSSNTIVVSGLDSSVKEETIEMYFESKRRSGGGDIETIKLRNKEAHITFVDPEVVQRVLSRSHKLGGKSVTVKLGRTAPENTIAVTEHGDVSLETVQMYFESKRKSGGGDTEEVWEEHNVFYLKFKSEEVFKRVLGKANHKVSGVKLTVVKAGEEPEVDTASEAAPEASTVVEVRGYPTSSTDDAIILYFENKRKSGGEEAEIVSRDDKKGVILLQFMTAEVASRVASRKHTLAGQQLRVKLSIPLVMYKDRVLLTGVPDCSEEALTDFLEARTQMNVSGFLYGDEEGDILVSFDEPCTDFKSLSQAIKKKEFMKTKLQVSEVPHTSSVTVRHLPENASEDNITMYFENSRRSGGEDVEETFLNMEDRFAVVKFKDPSVAERVCNRQHELERSRVEVSLHFECLGDSGGSPEKPYTKIPDPVDIKRVDGHVLQYLNTNNPAMETVKNAVMKSYGTLDIDQTNKVIKLSPTFTKEDKDAKRIAKTWTDDVRGSLLKCLEAYEVTKIGVNAEIWPDVEPKMNLASQQDVHVFTEEHNLMIVIVGLKGKTGNKVEEVTKIRNAIQEECDRKKNQVRLQKTFDVGKVKLLKAKGLLQEKFSEYITVQCNLETGEIDVVGPNNDAQKVVVDLYEMLNSVTEQKSSKFTSDMLELMRRPSVCQFLDDKQKNHNSWSVATWIAETKELKIYYTNGGFQQMLQFLHDAVQEKVIHLDKENVPLLGTKGFQKEIETIQREKDRVIICPLSSQRQILITAVIEDLNATVQAIDDYLQANSIYSLELQYSQPVTEFISRHCKDKLDSIREDLKQYCVTFDFKGNGSTRKIVLKATKYGKDQAKMFLDPIAGGVKCHEEILKKIGIENFLDGSDVLQQVERNTRCIIKRSPPTDDPTVKQTLDVGFDCETAFTCNPGYNKTITVVVGEYAVMATKAEAIVVETTPDLNIDTVQASSIMTQAGDEVMSGVRRRGLMEGDTQSTSSGRLPRTCKRLIFAVGPAEGSRNDPGDVIKAVVSSSLEEANTDGAHTIALPSFDLSSVRRSMSADDKFRYIFEGIKEHFDDYPETGLTDVYLCLSDTQPCQTVWGQSNSVFGQERVVAKNAEKAVEEEPEYFGPRHRRGRMGRDMRPLDIQRAVEPVRQMKFDDTHLEGEGTDGIQIQKPRILLVKADMGVEEADVIVSSSNTNLDLSRGMVSKSLLQHAGNSIQEECKAKYPEGIKLGEIAITKGGDMQCVEQIYHCVLPNYDANTGQQVLVDTLNSLLLKAHEAKWKTIAIPALGTGNLGYSRDLVAKTMYETVTQFGIDHPDTTLNDALFIVYPGDNESCRIFEAENKKHVEARGGTVAASQEEIDVQREQVLVEYRQNLVANKEIRDKSSPLPQPQQQPQPQPQPQPQRQSAGWGWTGVKQWWSGKKTQEEAPDFSDLNRSSSSADVTLWIYTDDDAQVKQAKDMIIKMMEGEEQTRHSEEPSIKGWTPDQIQKLQNLEYIHNVVIKVNKRLGRIAITGLLNNLSNAQTDIMQIIRAVDNAIEERKYAEDVQKLVQWYCQDTDEEGAQITSPYDTLLNAKLEKAYCRKNETKMVYEDLVFDFKDLVEYPKGNKGDAVKIIRKDLVKAGSTDPPDTWDKQDFAVIKIDKGTPEYQKVEKNITDSFAGKPLEIIRIDRVQNKTLYHQYKAKCYQLERQNPGVIIEKTLWHGTTKDNAMNINTDGFNRSHCDKTLCKFGEGVYFTTTAPAAADTYAPADTDNKRVLFQSRVLTGNFTIGKQEYRVPPQRGSKTDLYDSVVNDTNAPTVFVIFSDTQAYPEYLITIKY